MKINIEKIDEFVLFDKIYLSDSIFRFRIDTKNRFSEKIGELQRNLNELNNELIQHLENTINNSNYQLLGTTEELMRKDLHHALNADYYFTNGQKIISISKNENGWEMGKFGDILDFQCVISKYNPMSRFGLKSLKLETYKIYERVESLIIQELRELKMENLPLTNNQELKVQEIYPISKKVYFNNNEVQIFQSEELDNLTKQIEDKIEPIRLRTCLNCSNFMFSAMSHDMSGGETGYCELLRKQAKDKAVRETITHIWNWCSNFEKKKTDTNNTHASRLSPNVLVVEGHTCSMDYNEERTNNHQN